MIELTILSGSCVLELKFIAEQVVRSLEVSGDERVVLTARQEVFHIKPVEVTHPTYEHAVIHRRQLQCWYQRVSDLLND